MRFTDGHHVGRTEGEAGSALSIISDRGNWVGEHHSAVGKAKDDLVVLAVDHCCWLAIDNAGPLVSFLRDDHLHVVIYMEVMGGRVAEDAGMGMRSFEDVLGGQAIHAAGSSMRESDYSVVWAVSPDLPQLFIIGIWLAAQYFVFKSCRRRIAEDESSRCSPETGRTRRLRSGTGDGACICG